MSIFNSAAHQRMPIVMGSYQPRQRITMHPAVGVGKDEYLTAGQPGCAIPRLVRQQSYRALLEPNLGKSSANHVARLQLWRRVDHHDFKVTEALLSQPGETLAQSSLRKIGGYYHRYPRHHSTRSA